MRVKPFIFMVVFAALYPTQSVEAQTVYGFRIGANVGTLSGTFRSEAGPASGTGLVAGSFVRYALRNDFGVQVEVLYSQKGARFEAVTLGSEPFEQTLQVTYLELPFLLTYMPLPYVSLRPVLYAGGAVGFEIGEQIREQLEGFEQTQKSNVLRSPDFGLLVGADVQFSLGLLDALVGVRYTHGLRDLVDPQAATRPDSEAFTRTFALTVGFLF